MTYFTHLQCARGGQRFAGDRPQANACAPGDILEARYDLERVRRHVRREDITRGPTSLWRYAPLLPVADPPNAVSLGEGWTPLIHLSKLGKTLRCPRLYLKDESRNPSGTFKDRGASVAVSRLRELGVSTVALNSSGNAAAAWSLYASRAGMRCINLLPSDVLPSSLAQCVLAGAETFVLDGPWHEAGRMIEAAARTRGWFNCNTLKEPYRLEGKKTIGYELCEQLGWQLPDVIVFPTGGGLGATAVFKGFEELRDLGWVEQGHLPRLVVTQYEGCAPIVRAFQDGRERAQPWEEIKVLPGGLKAPAPPGDKAVLRLLRDTGGIAVAVSTEEALAAVSELARTEGIFTCPEAATTLVGLKRALVAGVFGREERIVVVSTGSGLKSVPNLPEVSPRRVTPGTDLGIVIAGG